MTIAAGDQKLLASNGGIIMNQDRGLRSGRKLGEVNTMRFRLWSSILVFGGVVIVVGYDMAVAGDPFVKSPTRLTYTVTEDGNSYAFWGPQVADKPNEDVVNVEMFLPRGEFAEAVQRAVQNPDGGVEYLVVLKGAGPVIAAQLCHTHADGVRECHP
jgi:hypothetical protein